MRISNLRAFGLFSLLWTLTACTDFAPREGGNILVLGDSVMAWNGNGDAAISDAIGSAVGRSVVSKAVPGAQFDNASAVAGAVGFDIRRQLPAGQWNWVVLNGGANDLSADCGCGACDPFVDALISPDAKTGAIPAFLQKLRRQTGGQVLWMGYYAGSGKGSFAGCRDDLVRMETRIARYAKSTRGVYFADAEDVIDRNDPSLFASDDVHPSAKGSVIIGAYLGRTIRRVDPRSQNER